MTITRLELQRFTAFEALDFKPSRGVNVRKRDTGNQMGSVIERMGDKRPRYCDLIKPNGLLSGARGWMCVSTAGENDDDETEAGGAVGRRPTEVDEDWFIRIQRAKTAREQGRKAREGQPPLNPIPRMPLSLRHD